MGSLEQKSEIPPYPKPLELAGVLEKFHHVDTTPAIGREFPSLDLVTDVLNAPNADELIRDLGITSKFRYQHTEHGHTEELTSVKLPNGVSLSSGHRTV